MKRQHAYIVPLIGIILLFLPLVVSADGGESTDNPWNKQVDPEKVTAAYQTGYEQMKAGNYPDAISAFKRVINLNDEHAMAYTNMAYSYRKLGKFKTAIKMYKKALAIEPNLAEAHEYMAGAWLALGKINKAKKHLVILETLDPKLARQLRSDIAREEKSQEKKS